MSANAFFWFYSASAQVFGALIGILGIFTVYVLEWIQKSIEWSREDLVRGMRPLSHEIQSFRLDQQLEETDREIAELQKSRPTEPRIRDLQAIANVIRNQRDRRQGVIRYFRTLLGIALVYLGFTLSLLPFCDDGVLSDVCRRRLFSVNLTLGLLLLVGIGIFVWWALERNATKGE